MIQDRPSWVNRPVVVAGIAFLIGAIVAGVVVAIILTSGDDDDDNTTVDGNITATPLPATGEATAASTGTPAGTPAPFNPRDSDDALANFVQQELDATYIGPCPQDAAEVAPQTICSIELYRSDELATFGLGPPLSEGIGEAVLTPDEDGVWSVTFVPFTNLPPVMGGLAVVIRAGDCLNFRSGPGTGSQPLTCQLDGTQAVVVGGPETIDGATWWQLRDLGWASGQYLQAAP